MESHRLLLRAADLPENLWQPEGSSCLMESHRLLLRAADQPAGLRHQEGSSATEIETEALPS